MRTILTACFLTALGWEGRAEHHAGGAAFLSPVQTPAPVQPSAPVYVPHRVFDTSRETFSDFEMMQADLARADAVLVGEQHDSPNTHLLERAMLEGLARRRVAVTLSLEMFERDVQASLDSYVAGTSAESDFLKGSRAWPRYASDYRPLVEFARSQHWPVVAANVPRRIASEIAKNGRAAMDSLSADDRRLAATDLQCPRDAYFDRFAAQMGEHSSSTPAGAPGERAERYYWAQCLKDETMAEAIAVAVAKQEGRPGVVVHLTGAFHIDFGGGTVERVRRRLAARRVVTVSILQLEDIDIDGLVPAGDDLKRADYLLYTIK